MPRIVILTATIVITVGCQNDGDRFAELARQYATQQSELSRETVELQAELIEGTQQLVEADSQSRRDFIELEGKLDEQRVELARRHDHLENERREMAKQRHRDPIVANAMLTVGSLLACLLPLLFAGYLLKSQLNEPDDHSVTEILLEEIAGHPAPMEPPAPRLSHGLNHSAERLGADTPKNASEDDDRSHTPG